MMRRVKNITKKSRDVRSTAHIHDCPVGRDQLATRDGMRFDNADIKGLLSIDGYVDLMDKASIEVALMLAE